MKNQKERFFDLLCKEDQEKVLEKLEIERELRKRMDKKGMKEFDYEIDYCNLNISNHLKNLNPKNGPKKETEAPKIKNQEIEKSSKIKELESKMPKIELTEVYDFLLEKTNEENEQQNVDIWQRLCQPKKDNSQTSHLVKDLALQRELQKCTFQPETSNSNFEGNLLVRSNDLKIEDRLYNDFKIRKERKEKLPEDPEMNLINQLEEQKKTNIGFNSNEDIPLFRQYKKVQMDKTERLEKLRIKVDEENCDLKFKPELNKKSEQIFAGKNLKLKNVIDRLLEGKKESFAKKLEELEKAAENQKKECPFKPITNFEINDEFLRNNEVYNSNLDFYEKQMKFEERKKMKIEKLEQEIGTSHIPQINPHSRIIENSNKRDYLSVDLNKRMYEIPFTRKQMLQKEMEKSEQEKYSFKPQINPISSAIAKKKTVSELSQFSVQKRLKTEQLKREKEEKETENCTFAPMINNNFKSIGPLLSSNALEASLLNFQRSKSFKTNIARKKEEFELLKDCVFRPTINRNEETLKTILHCNDLRQTVRGLDKFMFHQQKAKKLKEEKAEREERVFNVNCNYDYEKHRNPTVFVPFKLSEPREAKCEGI